MDTERFDKAAAGWDAKPRRIKLAQVIAGAIGRALPLTKTMTGLEYGCGTGLVTFAVAEQVGTMYGLDSSGGMIAVVQEKIEALAVTNVMPFHGQLRDLPTTVPLDLIVISMTLHHIDQYQELLSRCYDRLDVGGYLAIADLEAEDGTFHENNDGIAHFGFDGALLGQHLREYGFTDVESQTIYSIARNDREFPIFLITARKA